jgi:hypothetical protein
MEPSQRIAVLERRLRALTVAFIIALAAFTFVSLRAQSGTTDHLRVRQITVVDERGTERLWIGAPVPDPIVQGKRIKRSGPISGVVLLDQKGNERAGFATSDISPGAVFLGLDSEKGQEARFIVNPGGGGHLTFFDDQKNYARIGIWPDRPTLVLRNRGETILEQPSAR